MSSRIDFKLINRVALSRFGSLLSAWLPDGERRNGEWVALNPQRADDNKGSFSINMQTGVWCDFAGSDADKGGDPISLYAYLFNLSQLDAAKALAEELGLDSGENSRPSRAVTRQPGSGSKSNSDKEFDKARTPWVPILPVPSSAPEPHKAHSVRGLPEKVWTYRDANGAVSGFIYLFRASDGGKETLPHVFARNSETGAEEWRWMSFPLPRPLYGLERLTAKPDARVIITEGEKCADVAATVLPEYASLSWPGGCKAVDKADFSALAGRDVLLWPDADSQRERTDKAEKDAGVDPMTKPFLAADKQPGQKAMAAIAEILLGLGCRVSIIELPPPGTLKNGWDIADMVFDADWAPDEVRAHIRTHERLIEHKASPTMTELAQHADIPHAGDHIDFNWESALTRTDKGVVEPNLANAYLILKNDSRWDGVLAFDEFSSQILKLKPPPWPGGCHGPWTDADASQALVWLQRTWRLRISHSKTADEAARMVARDRRIHQIQDFLNALPPWDGVPRLEHMLPAVFGAESNPYTQTLGKCWLVSAVARVFEPGCKVDEMIILEGGQGIGKSTAIRELFGARWYLETSEPPSHKDFYIALQGHWVTEIGEMQSFGKAERNQVKMTITRRDDKFREPYDRYATPHPRQCVFVGTTNDDSYLSDPTGARRFLPVRCNSINNESVTRLRLLYWAEALHLYRQGFQYWIYPKDLAKTEQENRYQADPWEEIIGEWLNGRVQESDAYPPSLPSGPVNSIKVNQILSFALRIPRERQRSREAMTVGAIMRRFGWQKRRESSGSRDWLWMRPDRA